MINAEQIARAERILQVIYSERDVPNQLRASEVEIEAFNNWLGSRTDRLQSGKPIQWRKTPPVVHQMYNTLLLHFFLVGLVAGRDERTGIA